MNHPELPFDPRTLARSTDPDTSKDAAKASRDLRREHHAMILRTMSESTLTHDYTADEISMWCDLDRVQVGRRLGELERAGLVVKTENRRPTQTGRLAQCYRVTKNG